MRIGGFTTYEAGTAWSLPVNDEPVDRGVEYESAGSILDVSRAWSVGLEVRGAAAVLVVPGSGGGSEASGEFVASGAVAGGADLVQLGTVVGDGAWAGGEVGEVGRFHGGHGD